MTFLVDTRCCDGLSDNGDWVTVEGSVGWTLLSDGEGSIDLGSLSKAEYGRLKVRLGADTLGDSPRINNLVINGRESPLMAETGSYSIISTDKAELRGSLVDLENEESRIWFQWREAGEPSWNDTATRDLSWRIQFRENITGLVEGESYEYRAVAQDLNSGETSFGDVVSFVSDATPPTSFGLLSPTDGEGLSVDTVTFTWENSSDADSGLDYYEVWLDGSALENVPAGVTSYEASGVPEGSHDWYVVAVDESGNRRTSSDVFSFTITLGDLLPPESFELISPRSSWTTSGKRVLNWESSYDDDSGLDHYEVWLDGVNVENLTETYHLTSPLSAGGHSWYVVAVDGDGNERRSENVFEFGIGAPAPYPRRPYSDGFEDGNLSEWENRGIGITSDSLYGSYSAEWNGSSTGYAYTQGVELGEEEGVVSTILTMDGSNPLPAVGFASGDGTWLYASVDIGSNKLWIKRNVENYSIYDVTPDEWEKDMWDEDIVEDDYVWSIESFGTGGLDEGRKYELELVYSRRSNCVIAFLRKMSGFTITGVRTVSDTDAPKHPFIMSRGPARFDNFQFEFVDNWYYEWEVDLEQNPVLGPSWQSGYYDQNAAFNPGVQYHDGTFYMNYRAEQDPAPPEGGIDGVIGWATSTDGYNWTKQGIAIGGSGLEDPELLIPEGSDIFYSEYTHVGSEESRISESGDDGMTWENEHRITDADVGGHKVVAIIDTHQWPSIDEVNYEGTDYRYFAYKEAGGMLVTNDPGNSDWVVFDAPGTPLGANDDTWANGTNGEPEGGAFVDADGMVRLLTNGSTQEGYVGGTEATIMTALFDGEEPWERVRRGTIPWVPVYYGEAPNSAGVGAWNDGPNFPGQTILVDNWLWSYYGANDTFTGLARCYYGPVFEYRDLTLTSDRVLPGSEIELEVTVRNVGSARGGGEAGLYVDGVLENSYPIDNLGRDFDETIDFTLSIEENGLHVLRVGDASSTLLVGASVDNTPPAAPTGLSVLGVDSDSVSLDWDSNTEPDLDYYKVYRTTRSTAGLRTASHWARVLSSAVPVPAT